MFLNLESLRLRARLTQTEVAERMGVSQRRVSAIENGDDIQLSTLQRYLRALEMDLEAFALHKSNRLEINLN
ncbi:MAG: helix-turn-helix transcriptional regulator [Candidatus Nanopelagicales bacterium]